MILKKIASATLASLLAYSSLDATFDLPKELVQGAKADHAVEDIREGRLSYSRHCGWVDWGHARGDGPIDLIQHILREEPTSLSIDDELAVKNYMSAKQLSQKEYYPVVYFQQMKKTSLGVTAQVGTRSVYVVKKHLPKKMREGVAWRIFKEVSVQFEQLQGTPPYGLLPSTAASSFGIGDLTGDKISFYRALRGYSQAHLATVCHAYGENTSLRALAKQRNDPKGQARWIRLPGVLSVPKIPRGYVHTVIKDGSFIGEYK